MENKSKKDIKFLEGFKIIFVTLVAIAVPTVIIGLLIDYLLNTPLVLGCAIGLIATIILIISLGLHKSASENENTSDDDDDDDD